MTSNNDDNVDMDYNIDRLSKEGNKIVKRIFQRDKSEGGISLETLGPPGSGKTSLDLHIATKIINMFPDEYIFYRDVTEAPVQFNRIDKWHIFAEKKDRMTLRYRDYISNKYFNIDTSYFNSFDELYDMACPGQLNVIYFINDYTWIDFLNYLRRHMHHGSGWKSVFLEEYEDIAFQYASAEGWRKNLLYSKNAKNIRKGLVNTFANTQNKVDVSHFIRNKLMMRSYLRGAKVDDISPIKQDAIDALKIGQAMIDFGNIFGKINFKPFPPKGLFEVEKIITVTEEEEKKVEEKEIFNYIDRLEKKIKGFERIFDKYDMN